jgi:DNA-binding NtrC family response regulator
MAKILIIDDEAAIRKVLKEILISYEYEVDEVADGVSGLELIHKTSYDVVLCDIKMPKMDGIEVLTKIMEYTRDLPVIMISGHGTIETAVESIKKGAFDYLEKPLDLNRVSVTIRNALDKSSLLSETKVLKSKIDNKYTIIGNSKPIKDILSIIDKVAPTDARVLITGANGTGKELVAHRIHEKSHRNGGPFIEVNCAAIPSELIESVLFGHEKGAFTSAIKQRKGTFEQASGGTIFLDEIGDMSLSAQAKVLRVLQENKIMRVGGEKEITVDVRVIAATNKNLVEEINKGNFREDLYHRLSVIVIHVPSLNERQEDISTIAEYFLNNISQEYGKSKLSFTPEALKELENIEWTGNIRELRNVVERLAILCDNTIEAEDVKLYAQPLKKMVK